MNRKGFTLVEIMIVVAIIALLAAIAIPNLLSARMTANDTAAKANLRTLSTAAETYASANNGNYPNGVGVVGPPATLLTAYAASAPNLCGQSTGGYTYTCTLAAGGYTIAAVPVTVGSTGTRSLSISTGGVLTDAVAVAPEE